MNSARETKRRRLREEVTTNSQINSEISDNSNLTICQDSHHQGTRRPTSTYRNAFTTDSDTTSFTTGDQRWTEKRPPVSEWTEGSAESRMKGMNKDQVSEFLQDSSTVLESDCGTTWVAESSCLSVNGPNLNTLASQQVDIREQEEVSSLPTPDALALRLRNSLTTKPKSQSSAMIQESSTSNRRTSVGEESSFSVRINAVNFCQIELMMCCRMMRKMLLLVRNGRYPRSTSQHHTMLN